MCMLLQHFRVTASHLHAICSISEPQAATCNLFAAFQSHVFPAKYLATTLYYLHAVYILPIYIYHHLSMYVFPLIYDQQRIYTLLICNPTLSCLYMFIYYPLHACMQPTYIPLMARLFLAYIVQSTTDKLHQLPHPPHPPHHRGRGQPHTLPIQILHAKDKDAHVCVYIHIKSYNIF